MLANDSFNVASTSVSLTALPKDTTGLERIMLVAQGDLQRLLSTFFSRPIFIECIYAHTAPRTKPASPETPVSQIRQVHLVCSGRVVCIATSSVTITSPEFERLFLEDKYPIGQTFRRAQRTPQFSLLDVQSRIENGKRELRRTYKLETPGFECEILEVFPDRTMFAMGEAWLDEEQVANVVAPGQNWVVPQAETTVH
ncbi:hypothetical protein CONPUDRAFT_82806 [Coniophora puteana RWD-64-598 SS2]|uniref:Uncharacterized protein n=1 Tax=Coniophora puteana (strain RWD-64-598) TaxID=741705 RepID=A0A5M3MNL1_CONPW|nr:uncharacterized protein CONPUDRAFT_82806 [Coniophora puteana RWD-64-598 SS2]EIW80703.1 hypothetical protein CONPUDRAFT_82806 [Coniophora puteana RWD-64-598 SS2]